MITPGIYNYDFREGQLVFVNISSDARGWAWGKEYDVFRKPSDELGWRVGEHHRDSLREFIAPWTLVAWSG